MAGTLKVDVDGLIRGGSDIDAQATALSSSHRQSMIGLSNAEAGWVGSSADALVEMAGAWQQVADDHHAVLTRQAARVAEAAGVFQSGDERRANDFDGLGDSAAR